MSNPNEKLKPDKEYETGNEKYPREEDDENNEEGA